MHGRCVLKSGADLYRRFVATLLLLLIATAEAKPPAAPPDSVSVKVGRTVSVMFTQVEDRLITPNVLPDPVDGESVLTLKLTQNGPACTLYVTNGFGKTLNYRTLVRFRGSGSFVDSVTVPVRAYREGVMSFAARVEEIILYEIKLSD
jgi:hypothetical protein